jgi:hypothetical protein
MGTTTARRPARRRVVAPILVLTAGLALGACGGSGGAAVGSAPSSSAAPTTTVDAAARPYCDAVTRAQAQRSSPQAGQGGVGAASAAARAQIDGLVATAPPEIAADWRTVARLTDQALGSLAQTGGDPKKIDQNALATLQAQARPAVDHITAVTVQRCHVEYKPTG